jgi:hypothetical protein
VSSRRTELMRAAHEATAAYAARQKDTADARQCLSFGFGTLKQVDTAIYLESEARTRWLRATEAFINS